jgi:hypothetical protein
MRICAQEHSPNTVILAMLTPLSVDNPYNDILAKDVGVGGFSNQQTTSTS